jgi:hypothetical protein
MAITRDSLIYYLWGGMVLEDRRSWNDILIIHTSDRTARPVIRALAHAG